MISRADHGSGAKYTAIAMHRSETERASHEAMGFHESWDAALDQLVALVSTLDAAPAR